MPERKRGERHHWIPQSILRGFESPRTHKVPWFDLTTREVHEESRRDTAQMRGGNEFKLRNGEVVSSEQRWAKLVDHPIGGAIHALRCAAWESDDLALAARTAVAGLSTLPFRPPAAVEQRLRQTMRVNALIASVGTHGEVGDYVDALTSCLPDADSVDVRSALPPLAELREIAADPAHADELALRDTVDGPLSMGLLARQQWLRAWPVHVTIERAAGARCFQLADCGVLVFERTSNGHQPVTSTLLWDDALTWDEEEIKRGPRGRGRALTLRAPVTSDLSLTLSFDGRVSGTDRGWWTCSTLGDDVVAERNEEQYRHATHWIYGPERR